MKRALFLTLLLFLLVACSTASTSGLTPLPTDKPESTDTPTAMSTSLPTETPEPASTPTAMPTATPIPTFTISGVIFFDHNGNGTQDSGEPVVPNATVQIGALTATTGSSGSYTLQGVSRGNRQIRLSAADFRYISLSLDRFQSIEEPIAVRIEGDTVLDIGLMQGFLTLPFRCSDWEAVYPVHGFDHDPHLGAVKDYRGDVSLSTEPTVPGGTGDQHSGWDWGIYQGAPILAMAPGIATSWKSENGALAVRIEHREVEDIPGFFPVTLYGHLSEILIAEGQKVARGTIVGRAGMTGRTHWVHLHAGFCNNSTIGPDRFFCRDPYGVIFSEPVTEALYVDGPPLVGDWLDSYFRQSLWTVHNDPQCLP